jgi:hypothetical protein
LRLAASLEAYILIVVVREISAEFERLIYNVSTVSTKCKKEIDRMGLEEP